MPHWQATHVCAHTQTQTQKHTHNYTPFFKVFTVREAQDCFNGLTFKELRTTCHMSHCQEIQARTHTHAHTHTRTFMQTCTHIHTLLQGVYSKQGCNTAKRQTHTQRSVSCAPLLGQKRSHCNRQPVCLSVTGVIPGTRCGTAPSVIRSGDPVDVTLTSQLHLHSFHSFFSPWKPTRLE